MPHKPACCIGCQQPLCYAAAAPYHTVCSWPNQKAQQPGIPNCSWAQQARGILALSSAANRTSIDTCWLRHLSQNWPQTQSICHTHSLNGQQPHRVIALLLMPNSASTDMGISHLWIVFAACKACLQAGVPPLLQAGSAAGVRSVRTQTAYLSVAQGLSKTYTTSPTSIHSPNCTHLHRTGSIYMHGPKKPLSLGAQLTQAATAKRCHPQQPTTASLSSWQRHTYRECKPWKHKPQRPIHKAAAPLPPLLPLEQHIRRCSAPAVQAASAAVPCCCCCCYKRRRSPPSHRESSARRRNRRCRTCNAGSAWFHHGNDFTHCRMPSSNSPV